MDVTIGRKESPSENLWLVVYLPLWKIWVRQLGLWNSQYEENNMFQTTNQIWIWEILQKMSRDFLWFLSSF